MTPNPDPNFFLQAIEMIRRQNHWQLFFLLIFSSLCSSIFHVHPAQAQSEAAPDSVDLKDGPMQEIADKVRKALCLTTDEKNALQLDRTDWKVLDEQGNPKLDARLQQLLDRGIDPKVVERLANNMAPNQLNSPLSGWFTSLREHGMSNVGFSQRGNVSSSMCNNAALRCSATFIGSKFEFELAETEGRELSFSSSDNIIRILLVDEDRIALLTQSKKGKITGVLTGEKTLTGSSSDFLQFGIEHRELEQSLKQVFRHAGVNFPLTPQDQVVQQALMDLIRSKYNDHSTELKALIQELDSSDFAIREAATKKIEAGFEDFEALIAKFLEGESLAPKAEIRLDQITKKAQTEKKDIDQRVAQCIESNKLLESPEYLVGLLVGLGEQDRVIVTKLLVELTKQDFGNDPVAWRNWIENSNPQK